MLKQKIYKIFTKIIRQNRELKIVKLGEKISRYFLMAYWNEKCWDMEENGEVYLMKVIKKYFLERKLIVFDVGANHGQWSIRVKKIFPDATIHCFEIIPETFNSLSSNLNSYTEVISNSFGLSDFNRKVDVTYIPTQDSGSSIQSLPWKLDSKIIECDVITGDDYTKKNKIEIINFMKIDTEGHELFVLKGFSDFLTKNIITLIQFEYGYTCIPSKIILGDFYDFLIPKGYSIGRLYPKGVDFKKYDMFEDEHFRMGNYVAVHESAKDLIEELSLKH
ncbi:MAG: FkbM family methyltransferase [Hydrococcus sp. Prado102]|jgi:FkbM family methyltransferase|nr:FkbM family methyltransferase [Hydrococcus sp. Prado102]